MIQNDAQFEEALEEILSFFDHPPHPGGPDDGRLAALLADIEAYQPYADPPAPLDPEAERRARLQARVEDFLRRRGKDRDHSERLMSVLDGAVGGFIHGLTGDRRG